MSRKARVWMGRLLTAVAMAVIGVVVVNGQREQRKDLLPTFVWAIEIEGHEIGYVRSVDGLAFETEVIEFQEGGSPEIVRKLAGATRYANIRLTRPFTGDRSLYDWHATIQKPNPATVDGRITLFDRHGAEIAAWKFRDAFPVKWSLSPFDSNKSEVAVETLELAHMGFLDDEEKPPPPPPPPPK